MCVHACALIEEAQGRESTINWATWISHAELMRLKCVEQHRQEGISDHTHKHTVFSHTKIHSPHHTGLSKSNRLHFTNMEYEMKERKEPESGVKYF